MDRVRVKAYTTISQGERTDIIKDEGVGEWYTTIKFDKERMDRVRVKKYRAIKPRTRTGSIKDEGVSE
jgi:hypothetical protein